ncbi:hypothetical protein TNCV_4163441 [Trichonephila clavipes]|nr:hypothetical protein TNCV_4163441 [Trichonephila clavipes]
MSVYNSSVRVYVDELLLNGWTDFDDIFCVFKITTRSHLAVSPSLRRSMWYQHDEAPPYFGIHVLQHFNVTFGHRWISRGDHWLARSPYLSCLDFFL